MSANRGNVQAETYVYGGVLFQRVTEADVKDRSDHASIGTCLAQGLLTNAVLVFLVTLAGVLWFADKGFNFYAVILLSTVLCLSLVPGFVQALVIGLCIELAGHDLRWLTRGFIGALAFALFDVALILLFSSLTQARKNLTGHLIVLGILSAFGAICGIVTGSRPQAGRELVRRPLAFLKEEAKYYLID